jgi:hypothetical protein
MTRRNQLPAAVRCAIYTRKSTEVGPEQNFNSLDAQREACLAYVQSQRHEGWKCLPQRYDDGGFSGGLQRAVIAQRRAPKFFGAQLWRSVASRFLKGKNRNVNSDCNRYDSLVHHIFLSKSSPGWSSIRYCPERNPLFRLWFFPGRRFADFRPGR